MRAQRARCPNDNHGRMVVRVRWCPNCGEVLNPNISQKTCAKEAHLKLRRERGTFCMDCGRRVR